MDEGQRRLFERLRPLLGKWQGEGVARFPTISTFPFREEMEFEANEVQPLVHYDQRTWKRLETGEFVPSHWESGFWRILSEIEIEQLCAQSGGRVEVSRGTLQPAPGGFVVKLSSIVVANDDRMRDTVRQYVLEGGTFRHSMDMSTNSVSAREPHVQAELTRQQQTSVKGELNKQ